METSTASFMNQYPSTALPMFQSWCDAKQIQVSTFMKSSNAVNAMINLTLSLVTITGNILILLSLRRSSRLHAASKALYCSLAMSDLGVGLVVQPAFFIRLVAGPSIPETCEILGVIINVAGVISVGISLQILSAISVDRVLAIRLKMRYKEVASVFRVRLVLITCWFFSTFHAFSIFFSPTFFSLFQILGIILCNGVSTVSYIIIFHTLRKLQSQVQNYSLEEEASQNSFNIKRYKKSVSTALWVYASLLACYMPFMLSLIARIAWGMSPTFLAIQWCTVSMIYMNSALNPILYSWKIPEVRDSMKGIIKECCCCRK